MEEAKSIAAYQAAERIAAYDAEMEIMHPNRAKMVSVALEILPFERSASLTAVDLGVGTGYFTQRFLKAFPKSRVYAIDGSEAAIEMARERLSTFEDAIVYRIGDFRDLSGLPAGVSGLDVVYTSYAMHHLTREEKESTMRQALGLLKPGGWFVNADILVAESPAVEERVQALRRAGIMQRAPASYTQFRDDESTRRYLEEMEAEEGDQPLTLREDLEALWSAGFRDVAVWWQEYREAVTAGTSPPALLR